MSANLQKTEWTMAFSGIINAAPMHTLILFLVFYMVGDEQLQKRGDTIGFWVLGLSVPFGALIGVLVSAFSINRRKVITPNWRMLAGSWFVSTLVAYPASCVWTAIFSFSMPSYLAAAAMSAIWLLVALIVGAVFSSSIKL